MSRNPSYPQGIYTEAIGDEMYSDMQPLVDMYGDPQNYLWTYLHALGKMLQWTDDICCDGPNGEPGWSQIFDLTRTKTEWLAWTGQVNGYVVKRKSDSQSWADYDATERERIFSRRADVKGSVDILRSVVQDYLVPPRRVIVQERVGGNPDIIKVWVYASDIAPGYVAADVQKAAFSQKHVGLLMEFSTLTSAASYDALRANSATYAIVKGKFLDYTDLLTNPSKP